MNLLYKDKDDWCSGATDNECSEDDGPVEAT